MASRPLIPYMRKSSGEDPEQSRDRQRRAIRAWAELNGETLGAEVFEAHVSGSKPWRERELGQAIDACGRGDASGIVVEEQSRLSRENGLATAEVWEALDRAGARLVCAAEGLDTARGDQELVFSIRAALAREQWKQYRRRIQAAKRNAVERGVHIGPVPFGYTRERHQPLQVDPERANIVRQAFELRATGANYFDVIRLLDKLAPGGPSGQGAWNRGTVKRLLANRVYCGEARGSDGPPNLHAHEPLVDAETFAACQALARRREPSVTRSHSLLAGVVFCASCGGALTRSMAGGYPNYRCPGRSARGICEAPAMVSARALERLIDDAMRERLARVEIRAQFESGQDDERVDDLQRRIRAARAKRTPFEDPEYVAALGLDGAKRALARVDAEIETLEDQLADALTEHRSDALAEQFGPILGADAYDELVEADASLAEAGVVVVPMRRQVIRRYIERIVVSRGARGKLAERVRIIWHGEDAPIEAGHAKPMTLGKVVHRA